MKKKPLNLHHFRKVTPKTPNRGNLGVNVDPGLVAAIVLGVTNTIREKPSDFFGPGQPLSPSAQQTQGRLWDYPVGINTRTIPRDDSQSEITFAQLRGMADGCDILRIIIEKRKDQIEATEWEMVPREGKTVPDEDLNTVRQFFLKPCPEHDWGNWLRCFLEDLLVLDAVCVYPRMTKGAALFSLDLIDAATIRRIVDETGRTPVPPQPAYQQVLHGIVASNYSSDQLDYVMRNPRSYRLYGRSPVEWIITTVNTAIRRSIHQLQYYTEGNIPEAIASLPESWSMEQVRQFQMYWDSIMEGNTAIRRHMRFVPFDATKIKETKVIDLKDMFDEWIARLVCFAFGISPSFLIKDQNRATAETVYEQAVQEGTVPTLNFLKQKFTYFVQHRLGFVDIEFRWKTEEDIDARTQAEIDDIYIAAKVVTPDEVRKDRTGKEPLDESAREKFWPAPPTPFGPDGKPLGPNGGKPFGGPKDKDGNRAEGGGSEEEDAASFGAKVSRNGLKVVVAPNIHLPAHPIHMGDTYITTPEVKVGAVEVHADLRPITDRTVSKTVKVERGKGSSEGTVVEEEHGDEE